MKQRILTVIILSILFSSTILFCTNSLQVKAETVSASLVTVSQTDQTSTTSKTTTAKSTTTTAKPTTTVKPTTSKTTTTASETTTTKTTTTTTNTTTTVISGKTVISKNAAGVYASPTKSSAKSATMKKGQSYVYTSVYTGGDGVKWYLVTVGSSRGWVCETDASPKGTTSTTTSAKILTAKTAAGVYASPTKSSAKSATMKKGTGYEYTSVYIGGDKVKWYLTMVGSSRGWVCEKDITLGGTITTTVQTTKTTASDTTTTTTTTTPTSSSQKTVTAKSDAGAYASPTKSSAKSATMKKGQSYVYTSVYTGGDGVKWYLVTVGSSRGWVCETDASPKGTTSTTTSAKILTAKTAAGVYASPTKSSAKSATMKKGTGYEYTSVYIGGDKVKWYLTKVGSSRGWVCEKDVTLGGTITTTVQATETTASTTTTTTTITTTATTTTAPTSSSQKTVTAKSDAGAYASPTKSSAKSATMKKGQSYVYTSVYTGGDGVKWYLVTVGSSRGWVCETDTTIKSETSSQKTLTAKSAAGVYASPTKSAKRVASMQPGAGYVYTSVYTGGDKVKWYLITISGSKGWVCSSDTSLGGSSDPSSAVQNYVNSIGLSYGANGIQVAVIDNGTVVGTYNYGWATNKSVAMTSDTKIRVASISKVAVGICAMEMHERGIVNIEADISKYWGAKLPKPVTLRSLLTHTSTLNYLSYNSTRSGTLLQLKASGNYSRGSVGSSGSWYYNNYAVGVAGSTLEVASNQTLDSFAKANIFEPLGMDAAFASGMVKSPNKLATLYYADGSIARTAAKAKTIKLSSIPGNNTNMFAGGLTCSAKDLARLVAMLANDGTYNGVRVLDASSVSAIEKKWFTKSEYGGNFSQCMPLRYASNLYGESGLYYHTGNAYGVLSLISYNPSTGDGVVVITTGASTTRDSRGIYAVCGKLTEYMYTYVV